MDVRVAFWHRPEDVVWIDVGDHRRLQGFDTYWVADYGTGEWEYGVANDDENMGSMYDGVQFAAWRWDGAEEVDLGPLRPPTNPFADVTFWRGVMLTDEQARFVGLV